jgi:tryptophanyl-tRNA synthetase
MSEFGGRQFSAFKSALADLTVAKMAPIADEMRRLLGDTAEIDRLLRDGATRARAIAAPIMEDVKRVVGFVA